ncbi:MAG: VacJ family lipoprotein [Novosphingobium sp.]
MTIPAALALVLVSSGAGPEQGSQAALPGTGAQDVPLPSASSPSIGAQAALPAPAAALPGTDVEQISPAPPAEQTATEGEIVVTVRQGHVPSDPLRSVNAVSFMLTQKVDDAVVGPAARAYKHVIPKPVRSGFRNFLNNLREPVVFANYLIQLKPGKAAETVGRFAINSTAGLAGVFDVAKRCPFNLPRRPNGFSDTLGVYGIKQGPYLFLPLIGPTTVRELIGGAVDRVASPIALGGPFRSRAYVIGSSTYRLLDRRAEKEDELAKRIRHPVTRVLTLSWTPTDMPPKWMITV